LAHPAVHPSHYRVHELLVKYGKQQDVYESYLLLAELEEMCAAVPGSSVPRVEEVWLPSILVASAKKVAQTRLGRARHFALENKHGMTRTLDDEQRSAEAQYAACIILGLPLNHKIGHAEGRSKGNLGHNISAFCPRPGSFSLIVGENVPRTRRMVLMMAEGEHRYRMRGWIRAGAAQIPEYQREFVRGGVVSRPYIVPAEYLAPVSEWRD
jgi:hypothetical protein